MFRVLINVDGVMNVIDCVDVRSNKKIDKISMDIGGGNIISLYPEEILAIKKDGEPLDKDVCFEIWFKNKQLEKDLKVNAMKEVKKANKEEAKRRGMSYREFTNTYGNENWRGW